MLTVFCGVLLELSIIDETEHMEVKPLYAFLYVIKQAIVLLCV